MGESEVFGERGRGAVQRINLAHPLPAPQNVDEQHGGQRNPRQGHAVGDFFREEEVPNTLGERVLNRARGVGGFIHDANLLARTYQWAEGAAGAAEALSPFNSTSASRPGRLLGSITNTPWWCRASSISRGLSARKFTDWYWIHDEYDWAID